MSHSPAVLTVACPPCGDMQPHGGRMKGPAHSTQTVYAAGYEGTSHEGENSAICNHFWVPSRVGGGGLVTAVSTLCLPCPRWAAGRAPRTPCPSGRADPGPHITPGTQRGVGQGRSQRGRQGSAPVANARLLLGVASPPRATETQPPLTPAWLSHQRPSRQKRLSIHTSKCFREQGFPAERNICLMSDLQTT